MFIFEAKSYARPRRPSLAAGRRTIVLAFPRRKSTRFILLVVPCGFHLLLRAHRRRGVFDHDSKFAHIEAGVSTGVTAGSDKLEQTILEAKPPQ